MKLLIKMLGIGIIVAAAITYDRARLRRLGRLDGGFGGDLDEGRGGRSSDRAEVVTEAIIIGIADVNIP